MVIDFLGDSITEGCGASAQENCYVSKVGEILGETVYNCGIGGTRIARRKGFYNHKHDIDFNERVKYLPLPADYIFVFGGTNDYGHGNAPVGKPSDRTVWTFCGAVNLLIDKLEKKIAHDKIVFIIPCKRYGWENNGRFVTANLKDFADALKAVLKKREIKYVDLWEVFDEPENGGNTEFFADGLHPNDKGHAKIAEVVAEFIRNDDKTR